MLSLKNEAMLSYIHSLTLMASHRILGHSLLERSPPSESFASTSRGERGSDAGDLVDRSIEARVVLEKTKALETRMKYQIDKLLRLAEDTAAAERDVTQGTISPPCIEAGNAMLTCYQILLPFAQIFRISRQSTRRKTITKPTHEAKHPPTMEYIDRLKWHPFRTTKAPAKSRKQRALHQRPELSLPSLNWTLRCHMWNPYQVSAGATQPNPLSLADG